MQEKYKLLGPNGVLSVPELPEDWVERNGEGCPLFWHESKPIALWCALLGEWKVHAVLDCSPGSGDESMRKDRKDCPYFQLKACKSKYVLTSSSQLL